MSKATTSKNPVSPTVKGTFGLPKKKKQAENNERISLLLLKEDSAPKLGQFDNDALKYQITTLEDRSEISLRITLNTSGGYFSREFIPLSRIDVALSKLQKTGPFSSKALAEVFAGRSSNNAGFLVAILRHEGLLKAAEEAEGKHVVGGDFTAWKKALVSITGSPLEIEISSAGVPIGPSKKIGNQETPKWPKGTAT